LTAKVKPRFIEPMLLLRTEMLPVGPEWGYEIKLDGYRALAYKAEERSPECKSAPAEARLQIGGNQW
jgi:ATP-dependent DNA ligase